MSQVQAIPQSESKGELKNATRSVPIIKKINEMIAAKKPFYSFEYFPPKTAEGVQNLSTRLERMAALQPMFMDVTWGAGGTTAELTMEISSNAQQFLIPSPHVMPHLTCTNMPTEKIKEALEKAKAAGIRNILALRGDPPKGMETWEQCEGGFGHAVDLVKHIRQEHKDYFGVAVAGYPEGHVSAKSIDEDIKYLKQKVDAGADFIITQLFYDVGLYVEWVKKCRAAGITVPIIPGIMPIQDYNGFKRMTGFCKTFVPKEINDALEPIKNDDARVKAYGIELGTQMCKQLLAAGAPGLHFYTLNLEKSVTSILENLGFISSRKDGAMPWKQAAISKRDKEEVRPIFWANRPHSYLDRTTGWDEFPNGRWGDVASPAFGDLSDYHLCSFRTGKKEERVKIWGASPKKEQDIYDVFAGFIDGDVPRLPWCENVLQLETIPIKEALKKMNKGGFLTINSQPRVNGEKSTNASVGWGGPGGYVYQKAYLEFFVSPANLERMIKAIGDAPSLAYTAIDAKGNVKSNCIVDGKRQVTAVTWGVFPNKEIVQPTVVDTYSFQIWKDEAFALWQSQWESIYEEGSDSRKLLKTIRDTYFLVNVVDNDYVNGDIFAFFVKLLA